MLVLSRKNHESVYIKVPLQDGTEKVIQVQIVGTGKLVKLGLVADKDVTILRHELLERPIDKQKSVDDEIIPQISS